MPLDHKLPVFDLITHIARQIAFSRDKFGPGERDLGVSDHIRKELDEIRSDHEVGAPTTPEWIDVIILAFDGAWRSLSNQPLTDYEKAETIAQMWVAKQSKNERRKWPDWRTAEPGKAIEHVRGHED
jgi:hypothetical protein